MTAAASKSASDAAAAYLKLATTASSSYLKSVTSLTPTPSIKPTYTPWYGKLEGKELSNGYNNDYAGVAEPYRTDCIKAFHTFRTALETVPGWFIAKIPTSIDWFIDNSGYVWNYTDGKFVCDIPQENPCQIPLSDQMIDEVKKIRQLKTCRISISSGFVYGDQTVDIPITSAYLQPYRSQARLEYILHQCLTPTPSIKPLESAIRHLSTDIDAEKAAQLTLKSAIHRLTTDLEAEKTKTKMLEARLSVLEAFLAPKPSPPKEIDLLGLTDAATSPLATAVTDANELPSLLVTDTA